MLSHAVTLQALGGHPALLAVSGVGSALILLAVLGMCTCREKKQPKSNDIELHDVRVVEKNPKKKKNGKGHKKQTSNVSVIDTELGENRHSNGSVANGKTKGHVRALPAIPSPGGDGTMPTDDEMDDDPGHYDVITRKAAAPKQAGRGRGKASKKRGEPNTYEKVVGDPDSDSTYAGIKEDNESAKLSFAGAPLKLAHDPTYSAVGDGDPVYSGIKDDDRADALPVKASHPYAVVTGVGDAQYAHIDEVAKQNRRSQLQQSSHAAESGDTGSTASDLPPLVPDKHFDGASDTGELAATAVLGQSSSPSLPPRNSMAAANGNGFDISFSSDGGVSLPQAMVMPPGGPAFGVNGASTVHALLEADDGAAAGPSAADIAAAEKEARYSKVTARESLDSLKRRQTELQRHAPPANIPPVLESGEDAFDSTYASVTYDEIRSPGASGVVLSPPAAGDRDSLTSDLYAEISSGQNSTRSSTYARVFEFGSQAPAPPSVDALKKRLTDPSRPRLDEDDTPDPGYSAIKRPRPQSVHSTASAQNQPTPSGRRSPVYAVVDKSQKARNRQTVHVSDNVGQDIAAPPVTAVENLYSEVDKTKKGKAAAAAAAANGGATRGGGARPKVRNNHLANTQTVPHASKSPASGAQRGVHDPGYQTIGSVVQQRPPVDEESDVYDPNYDSIPHADPDYDRIKERNMDVADGGSDYDPNYESVTALTASITGSSAAVRGPSEPGVAREIPTGAAGTAGHPSGGERFLRREPIYQDIDEAKGGSSHGKPQRMAPPRSTAL